jgi:hypothetical protein
VGLSVTELTALQKAQQMAHRDDYRDEDDAKAVKSSHRLTRKKRRRLDALKELEENGESESALLSSSLSSLLTPAGCCASLQIPMRRPLRRD